tara:strand:- start:129 stop:332 length:204 start_codon:yes stop_codon:yes gene_type:complete
MYQVLGYADTSGSAMLHETDNYSEAKSWVVGYVRNDGLRQSGWEELLIQNKDGEPQSAFDKYGWTHY